MGAKAGEYRRSGLPGLDVTISARYHWSVARQLTPIYYVIGISGILPYNRNVTLQTLELFSAYARLYNALIKLICILLKRKYIQDQNYAILAYICCESDAILFKKFRPGDRAGVFIGENVHPGYRDIGRKNRDLGNRASPASHMSTSIFLPRKEWRGEISETEPARLTGFI